MTLLMQMLRLKMFLALEDGIFRQLITKLRWQSLIWILMAMKSLAWNFLIEKLKISSMTNSTLIWVLQIILQHLQIYSKKDLFWVSFKNPCNFSISKKVYILQQKYFIWEVKILISSRTLPYFPLWGDNGQISNQLDYHTIY